MTGVATAESQSTNPIYNLRRTRQRVYKPRPPLNIPTIIENAAERKRVLNVLAQRRYSEQSLFITVSVA